MDFIDRIKTFAAAIPNKLDGIKTEAGTQQFLVIPFIQQILGYDTSDPNEVMPQYDANVGAAKKFKLDYAIFQDGKPSILIECKCYGNDFGNDHEWSQLFAYFSATDARIGILTNGVIYKFYADLERPNKMDKTPFLELNLLKLNESSLREVSKLTKSTFDIKDAISSASELKYVGGIKALLREQLKSPNDDFAKYFFKELCPENLYTGKLKNDFLGYTLRGVNEFITEEMKKMVDDFVNPPNPEPNPDPDPNLEDKNIEFTEDEREAYYIIKGLLSELVSPARITYRDTESYCNILLDDNGRKKKVARLYFNKPKNKKIVIFLIDAEGNEKSETFPINDLNEIYQYADKLKAIVISQDRSKDKAIN